MDEYEQLTTKPGKLREKIDAFTEAMTELTEVIRKTQKVIAILSGENEVEHLCEKLRSNLKPFEETEAGKSLLLILFVFSLFHLVS
jgi:hypothetical protein